MTNVGAIILSVFATVWAILAVVFAGLPTWWLALPLSIGAAIVFAAARAETPVRGDVDERRVGRLVGWASAAEGVGIAIVANVEATRGHPDLIPAAIAAVVGLHFIPLARGIPVPLYYVTAILLLCASIGGFVFAGGDAAAIVCAACALILWATVGTLVFARPHARTTF